MAQGVLPYKYEEERNYAGMTALAGLPTYLDLASVLGVADCIGAHVNVGLLFIGIRSVFGIAYNQAF
jgi:hypothetical protein